MSGNEQTFADFTTFYKVTAPLALARAIMLGYGRQDAEDAVQEACFEAFMRWDQICRYDLPEAWVFTVMAQRLRRGWAKGQREKQAWEKLWDRRRPVKHNHSWDLAASSPDPERAAEVREVLEAVGALPPSQRTPMLLHCLLGLSQQEVAGVMGITGGTVRKNIYVARRKLQDAFGMTPTPPPEHRDALAGVSRLPVVPVSYGPLTALLRETEAWVSDAVQADQVSLARIREGISRRVREHQRDRT